MTPALMDSAKALSRDSRAVELVAEIHARTAELETVGPIVDAYNERLFEEWRDKFPAKAMEGDRNPVPRDKWTRDNFFYYVASDSEEYKEFYVDVENARDEAGFRDYEPGVCPKLHADWMMTKARNELRSVACGHLGIEDPHTLELMRTLEDTTIGLVSSGPKSRRVKSLSRKRVAEIAERHKSVTPV